MCSPLLESIIHCARNSYDPTHNPHGWINAGTFKYYTMSMIHCISLICYCVLNLNVLCEGTAENTVSVVQVRDAFTQVLVDQLQPRSLKYDAFEGAPDFLRAVATFMQSWMNTGNPTSQINIHPSTQLVASCGTGTALSNLSMVIADAGAYVMIPTPCYGALPMDIGVLAGLKMEAAPMPESTGFALSVPALESCYSKAVADGKNVRVLLLTSPDNPTGRVHSYEELLEVFLWARSHNLHLVSDEIYADSVHSGTFTSLARVIMQGGYWDDAYSINHVHIVYGFAKDFAASGLRTGIIYTRNATCHKALVSISPFSSISRPTQVALTGLLSNESWLTEYRASNSVKLKNAYSKVEAMLTKLSVPFVPAFANLFLCLDLRKFLRESTVAEEMRLFKHMFTHKLFVTPGSTFFFHEVRSRIPNPFQLHPSRST
jgi:aspartate/methionine/tyrosine aminotransferase